MIAGVGLLAHRVVAERRATRRRRKLDRAALDGEFTLDRPHGLLGHFAALAREVGALEQARIASAAAVRRRASS